MRAAFVLALFGWGVGFYGPPIFLYAVVVRTGWTVSLVSAAVTLHFLFGASVVACLPRIHRRIGIPATTAGGAVMLALGTSGWATAVQPWQLCLAALFTGAGWVPLGAAGINAIVSPWFGGTRPMALAKAYNGASLGGVLFSPMWVALIGRYGFLAASMAVGLVMIAVVLPLASRVLTRKPADKGEAPGHARTGDSHAAHALAFEAVIRPIPSLWRSHAFLTLAAAMALGLFAQIGMIAQLFSLLVPTLGAAGAGWVMSLATGCGMAGRLFVARLLGTGVGRRRAACASYAIQACGTALLMAAPDQLPLIVLGVALFGLGIGNATSLPPLIAQAEFALADVPRVVARCVASAQALYAFAPAALALLLTRDGHAALSPGAGTRVFFGAVLLIQLLAIACMWTGRRRAHSQAETAARKR